MEIRVDYNNKDGKKIIEASYFFSILAWSFFSGIEENIYILKTIHHLLDYELFLLQRKLKKAGIE